MTPVRSTPLVVGVDARELQGRPTGTGRYLRNLLRVWTESGDDRFVLYFNGPVPDAPVLARPRLRTRPVGATPTRGLVWLERRLPAAVGEDRPDVFFAPAYVCPLSLRLPRVTAVHDLSFFAVPHDFPVLDGIRRRALVGASVRASAATLAPSAFSRREIAARFPDCAGRVVDVPLGADDDLAAAPDRNVARRRLELTGPLLLSVGSILNRRRLPVLLRAVQRLLPAWPRLRLDVVGDDRTHPRLDAAALVERLGLAHTVRLTGFVTEDALAERYAAADAVVFLSEYEGFGLPVLEAMARGVPVVAGRRPALSELFAEAAVLVEPDDVAGVAAGLDRVLGNPELRRDLVTRGRALAGRFSWRDTAARTLEVLRRAAGR